MDLLFSANRFACYKRSPLRIMGGCIREVGRIRLGSVHPRIIRRIGGRGVDFLTNMETNTFAVPKSKYVGCSPVFGILRSTNCRKCVIIRTRRSPTGTGPLRCTVHTEGFVTRGANLWLQRKGEYVLVCDWTRWEYPLYVRGTMSTDDTLAPLFSMEEYGRYAVGEAKKPGRNAYRGRESTRAYQERGC